MSVLNTSVFHLALKSRRRSRCHSVKTLSFSSGFQNSNQDIHNFIYYFTDVSVSNQASHVEGSTEIDGIREQTAEEGTWTYRHI
jgi:hypothetical protein